MTISLMSIFSESFWNRAMDPRVHNFPFMSDGFPWRILSIAFIYFLIVKLWKPSQTKNSIDFKPWLLIQNGFNFGIHGAGFIIALFLSNMGREGLDCTPLKPITHNGELTFNYVRSESTVHLSAVLLFIRMFMFTESIVLMIHKGKKISNWRITNDIALFIVTFLGVKYLPGGPSLFFGLTYMAFYAFTYGYYTLRCGYPETDKMVQSAKKFFVLLKFFWSATSIAHFAYLVLHPTCYASSVVFPISFVELAYGIGTFLNGMEGWREMKKEKMIEDKNNNFKEE